MQFPASARIVGHPHFADLFCRIEVLHRHLDIRQPVWSVHFPSEADFQVPGVLGMTGLLIGRSNRIIQFPQFPVFAG